jgi:hypothetical protein
MSAAHPVTGDEQPGALERYLDGSLNESERATLLALLQADPAACQAFVAELRLASAIGTALEDGQAGRALRADLLMATLSESRTVAALRGVEAAIGLSPAAAGRRSWWLPWAGVAAASAAAAALLLALLWHARESAHATVTPPGELATTTPAGHAGGAPAVAPHVDAVDPGHPAAVAPSPAPERARDQEPAVVQAPAPLPVAPAVQGGAGEIALLPSAPTLAPVSGPDVRPPALHATHLTGGSETMRRPQGAESWLGGRATIHRQGATPVLHGSSLVLSAGDVVDTPGDSGCELHLGADLVVTVAPATRVVVLAQKPGVPGRWLYLMWGEVGAMPDGGPTAVIATAHGEVRCDSGRTSVHAFPDWVRIVVEGGHARVGSDPGRKSVEDGSLALLVHGRSVIAPLSRSASAVLASDLTVGGEAVLPCVLRLREAPPPGGRRPRLHALAEAGFTALALPAGSLESALLNDAQDAALGVVGLVASDSASADGVARGHAHPALLAWWMAAAPGDGQLRDSARIAAVVRGIDPLHAIMASFSGDAQRAAPPACDLLVLDGGAGDAMPAMAARWTGPAAGGALRAKAVLATIPLSGTPLAGRAAAEEPPLAVRLRCLAYLALADGARGLVWSGYAWPAADAAAQDEAVGAAGALSAEIALCAPLFLHGARSRIATGTGTGAGALVAARFDGDGRAMVVLVNPTALPYAVSATVPGPVLVAPHPVADDDAGVVTLSGDRLSGTLPPGGVVVLAGELPFVR